MNYQCNNNKFLLIVISCLVLLNIATFYKYQDGIKKSLGFLAQNTFYQTDNQEIKKKLEEIQNMLKSKDDTTKGDTKIGGETFESLFDKYVSFSKDQVESRKNLLRRVNSPNEYYNLYGSLAAEVYCVKKVRIGNMGDGGKWMCNPWKIPDNCVILSLGLNNLIDFDIDIQKMTSTRCRIIGIDSKDQNGETKGEYSNMKGTLKTALISQKTDAARSTYTIEDLAKMNDVKNVEILKIDIEEAEHTVLIPFLQKFQVCQILIEVHGGANQHKKLLNELSKLGYRLFSYEVNGYAMFACEYSFIHDSCISKYNALPIANYLDF